jgi:hypothetical protein
MVSVKQIGTSYQFEVWEEPPLIYLDHWALRLLSEDLEFKNRFLVAFARRGTVMFSLMNVVEVAKDPGNASQIRDFLARLGPHWVPVTIGPFRVIDAEESGRTPDGMDPCMSIGFLTDPMFVARLVAGTVSLAHVVDLTRETNSAGFIAADDRTTDDLLREINTGRGKYASDPQSLEKMYPNLSFDRKAPMRGIYNGLIRLSIKDSFPLNRNHARDLYHALVPVRCADMVTLDNHWSGQVQKLRLPVDFVRVYSRSNFQDFLRDLEAAGRSR